MADKCVRAGAAGTASGDDWTNAYTALPASLNRGDTYYIADGSYGSYTFDDANSGTTRITVKKATESAHGPSTGWNSTYGDGQADWTAIVFGGGSANTGGYITFDGVTGGGPDSWETGFGFVINGDVGMPQFVDRNADQIIFQHVEVNVGAVGPEDSRAFTLYASDGFTIRYCYIHDIGMDVFSINVMNDFTVEYCKVARNHSSAEFHGDIVEYQITNASNFVIRWNFFEDCIGSYGFGSHDPTITGYYIYGNIFYWTEEMFFGNGLVGTLSGGGTLNNAKFFNNTIAGAISTGSGTLGLSSMGGGTGADGSNNLWYRASGSGIVTGTTTATNTSYNGGAESDAEEKLTGNPFANFPTSFELAANSTAGTDLGSPYNTDMFGNVRATWTRGAIEFDGSPPAGDALNATNLNATTLTVG